MRASLWWTGVLVLGMGAGCVEPRTFEQPAPVVNDEDPPGQSVTDPGGGSGSDPGTGTGGDPGPGEEEEEVPPKVEEPPVQLPPLPTAWRLERDSSGWPKLQTTVPEYELVISQENLDRLNANLNDDDLLVPAKFKAYGRSWDVQVRYRGASSRKDPKKSFQVRFDSAHRFEGRKRTELLAEYADGGVLSDKVWYDYGAYLGLKLPLARLVFLKLNGKDYGVFTELESVVKGFLENHGLDDDSDIYRAGMFDGELRMPPRNAFQEDWTKRTNEDQPWDELWEMLTELHKTPAAELEVMAATRFDLDQYLTWMAMDALIAQAFQGDARCFLIRDPRTGKWTYVPWDLNNARSVFRRHYEPTSAPLSRHPFGPGFSAWDPFAYDLYEFRLGLGYNDVRPTWNNLTTRILQDPMLKARYLARIEELLRYKYSEAILGPRIDATAKLIAELVKRDPYIDPRFPPLSADYLRRFVRERRSYLSDKVYAYRKASPHTLRLSRVGRDATGRWFTTLTNETSAAIALGEVHLTADTRNPKAALLPAMSLEPGASVTLWTAPVEGELLLPVQPDVARPELALFSLDGRRPFDLVFLPDLQPDQAYSPIAQEEPSP